MIRHLDRFYELLAELAAIPGQGPALADCDGRMQWPQRGVYFFREPGEGRASNTEVPRIVRVGTHALGAGAKSSLWGRLRAHRGHRDGRGNHRGSIFRLHVGAAMLQRDGSFDGSSTWAAGQSAARAIREQEVEHERKVSAHIGRMTVLWLDVPDEPGPKSTRGLIERNAIALLSNGLAPADPPSPAWLGLHSPREEIRRSGLWNLNHVLDRHDSGYVSLLADLVMDICSAHGETAPERTRKVGEGNSA